MPLISIKFISNSGSGTNRSFRVPIGTTVGHFLADRGIKPLDTANVRVNDKDVRSLDRILKDGDMVLEIPGKIAGAAKKQRREVESRMAKLICHRLKCKYQSEKCTSSWHATIIVQQSELRGLLESSTLKNHADEILPEAYRKGRKQAADETGMNVTKFPENCEWDVDELRAGYKSLGGLRE